MINDQVAQATAQGQTIPQEQVTAALEQAKTQVAPFLSPGLAVAHLALGFLVMALVTSLGGPTGPGLNHPCVHQGLIWKYCVKKTWSKVTSWVQTGPVGPPNEVTKAITRKPRAKCPTARPGDKNGAT